MPEALQPYLGGLEVLKPLREPRDATAGGPRLVALDIDGTLLKWVEGAGQTYEQIPPAVYAAVHRALDAGAHVVLASGRSPHGMTQIADLLELARRTRRRPALGGGLQRRGGLPLPAGRGRARGDLRRAAGRRGGAASTTRTRWSRSRSAASATASTGPSPTASCPAT